MELSLAIVSDLHCHHSSQTPAKSLLLTDSDRWPSSHHPVQSLRELIDTHSLQANILVMPGDITNEVDRQGMISGWGFIQEIAVALGRDGTGRELLHCDENQHHRSALGSTKR